MSSTEKKNQKNNSNNGGSNRWSSDDKKLLVTIAAIILVFSVTTALIFLQPWRDDTDVNDADGSTASTISASPTPSVDSVTPRTTTRVLPNGTTVTNNLAPDHLGLDDDAIVGDRLATATPGEDLPADPEEGVIKTLTVPTTPKFPPGGTEPVDLHDPAFGSPQMLAENLVQRTFSLCIADDTSYAKNFKKFAKGRTTSEFYKRGIRGEGTGDTGHNDSWRMYAAGGSRCTNKVTSFPEIIRSTPAAEDKIAIYFRVKQMVSGEFGNGNNLRQNLFPFNATVMMNYVDGKWLASDLTIWGDSKPKIY